MVYYTWKELTMSQLDRDNPIVTIIPEDRSPESIAGLTTICVVLNVGGGGIGAISTETYSFNGSVEEKLMQYQQYFGTEWPGYDKENITEYGLMDENKHGLFDVTPKRLVHPGSIRVQKQIDALVEDARRYIRENKALKRAEATKKLVEASVGSGTNEDHLAGY